MDEVTQSPQDLAKAEKLRGTVTRVCHEGFKALSEYVADVANIIAQVGPKAKETAKATTKAHQQMQLILGRLTDFLSDHFTKAGKLKASMPRAAVIQLFNDVYNGMLHASKRVGWRAYDSAQAEYVRAMTEWNALPVADQQETPVPTQPAGSRTDWGKTAHRPWTGKRRDIQNICASLLSEGHAREMLAVLSGAVMGKPAKWVEISRMAFQVHREFIADDTQLVLYGHPVGDPDTLWVLRNPRSEYTMRDTEDGERVTDIVWGQKPHNYTMSIVIAGTMKLNALYDQLEAKHRGMARAKSKIESDMRCLEDLATPEVLRIQPTKEDPWA